MLCGLYSAVTVDCVIIDVQMTPKVCDVLAKKLPRRGRAGQFFESKKCRAPFKKLPCAPCYGVITNANLTSSLPFHSTISFRLFELSDFSSCPLTNLACQETMMRMAMDEVSSPSRIEGGSGEAQACTRAASGARRAPTAADEARHQSYDTNDDHTTTRRLDGRRLDGRRLDGRRLDGRST